MINQELLDYQFRELFKDPTQTGFKADDHITIKMIRNSTLKTSHIEVYKDDTFWFRERLGRFNTYKGFFNAISSILCK